MTCKEASELYSLSMDRPLPWYRRLYLRLHLWICACPICHAFAGQMDFLRAVACLSGEPKEDGPGGDVGLPDEAKERMKALLARKS